MFYSGPVGVAGSSGAIHRRQAMSPTPEALIDRFHLIPHPEGGWYRELHRSRGQVRRTDDGQQRAGLTVIAFLLTAGQVSRWHRVAGADETWHHAGGAPLDLWRLPPRGGNSERLVLGPLAGGGPEQAPLQIIPAGWWQAARSQGRWSFLHCCVGPGFDFTDFSLMAQVPPQERPAGADPSLL
jgi:predicted cupin superfamily sugar epimerase